MLDERRSRAQLSEDLRVAITSQTRQVFFGMIGVVAAFGGLIIAAARIR